MKKNRSKTILIGVTVDHAIVYHEDLAVGLAENGWEVHFISSGGPSLDRLSKSVKTYQIKMSRQPDPLRDLRSLVRWMLYLKKIKPSVVVVGTPKASLLGMSAAWLFRVPNRIYWLHGLRLETATGLGRKILWSIELLTSFSSTRIIAVSGSLKKKIISMGIAEEKKVTVLGHGSTQGVDLQRFDISNLTKRASEELEKLELLPGVKTIGFVGRLTRDKGIIEFREALRALSEKSKDFQVLLVGPAEDDLGQALADDLRDSGIKVVATGQVTDTASYYQKMDVMCLPSYREGLPNVVLEAFASRVPVVSTTITGVVDIVQAEETGLLVPPRNSIALAVALERIISDNDLAANIANSAYKYVVNNFDSRRVLQDQLDFIEYEFNSSLL